jgi:mRNA interferase MazF
MAMNRGEIWWADLAEPRGSEPGDRRPVLVVQDDLLTASALSTVMVVPLTTNLRRAEAIGSVRLPRRDTGLPKESVALVCQVMTLDKTFFDAVVRPLPVRLMRSVDLGLQLALSL